MKIRLFISVFAVIVALFLLVTPVSAQVSNGGDDIVTSTTVSNGSDDTAGFAEAESATVTTTVSNGGDDVAGFSEPQNTSVTTTVSNGDDDDKTVVTTPTDSNTSSNSGSSRRRSGGSSSSAVSASCPLITSNILKMGAKNDAAEVARLQAFLKDVEKMNVEVNGSFDAQTEVAVKSFQIKYKDTILAPWDATRASGIAYITTIKKINDIACKQSMTLSASELAIIKAYGSQTFVSGSVEGSSSIDLSGVEVGSADDVTTGTDSNVAGAAQAPVLKRFWNFMTGLFR
ncbi:MAG: peptidoglycan-binding domain-containing protein [Patescibacteria group bacterium]